MADQLVVPRTTAGRLLRRAWLRLPDGARTIRVRLTLTYSALLFGITALILVCLYVALSQTIVAEPPLPPG